MRHAAIMHTCWKTSKVPEGVHWRRRNSCRRNLIMPRMFKYRRVVKRVFIKRLRDVKSLSGLQGRHRYQAICLDTVHCPFQELIGDLGDQHDDQGEEHQPIVQHDVPCYFFCLFHCLSFLSLFLIFYVNDAFLSIRVFSPNP